jgi:DNA-binding transcriptional regulator YiaG
MRAAKKQNLLTKAKIQELDQIGFTWSIDLRHPWEQRFKELEAFKRKHGHCNVPRSYPLNQQVAYWVDKLRSSKRKGKLDKTTIRRLDELGFCWSLLHRRFHRRDLDELVAILTAFKERHGHCNLIAAHEGLDLDLVDWLKDVRKSKKQGRLDPRYIRQLERLGFVWRPKEQNRQEMYSALLDYRKRYGDCRVPSQWPKNRRLASWVERMRAAKRRNKLTHAQIQELDRIGFIWSIALRHTWEQRFKELEAFKKEHGHCNVPENYPLNPALGHWVSAMRHKKKCGKLTEAQIQELDRIGFIWNMDFRHTWKERFRELEAFKKNHGHCNVPKNYPLNPALGHWVSRMRHKKKRGKLTRERVRHLAALGFCWVTKRHGHPRGQPQTAEESTKKIRFSARSVKAQRKQLGLSGRDYGKLVGVSGWTIYHWESGKSRPRKAPLARCVAVRGIGKREAAKRLEEIEAQAKKGR